MIQAVSDDVIVRPIYASKVGSIFLAGNVAKEDRDRYGLVISIGPDARIPGLKVGDKILWQAREGREIEYQDIKLMVVQKKWLKAILED